MPFAVVRLGPLAEKILEAAQTEAAREIRSSYSYSGPKFAALKSLFDLIRILLPLNHHTHSFPTGEMLGTSPLLFSDTIGWKAILHFETGNPDLIMVHYMHRVDVNKWPTAKEVIAAMRAEFQKRGIP